MAVPDELKSDHSWSDLPVQTNGPDRLTNKVQDQN